MIRIAFVSHGMETGGIERSITRIASGLNRNSFQPVVICLTQSGPTAKWLPDDVPVIEIKKRSGNDFFATRRLAAALRKHRIDLVQSHNWGTLVETVVARKLARVRAHIHAERGTVLGSMERTGWKPRMRAMTMRTVLRTVDQLMSNSHAVAAQVESCCGYPVDRITIIPNGVPAFPTTNRDKTRRQIRESLGIAVDTPLIGSVGRLNEVKGFDVLLRAIRELKSSQPNAHLVIVGEGDQRSKLETIANEEGICDRVHLVGHHEDVAPWLIAMDLYVNSSRSEGMSQSICEAMSVGLPIVATDVGDAKKMICRDSLRCGEVCSPESSDSLATSLARLLSDIENSTQCGLNSSTCHQSYYSESNFIGSMESLYRKALRIDSIVLDALARNETSSRMPGAPAIQPADSHGCSGNSTNEPMGAKEQ